MRKSVSLCKMTKSLILYSLWSNTLPFQMIWQSGEWCIGGDIEVIQRIKWNDGLDQYRKTPNELRAGK